LAYWSPTENSQIKVFRIRILHVVLFGRETSSVMLREVINMRVIGKR